MNQREGPKDDQSNEASEALLLSNANKREIAKFPEELRAHVSEILSRQNQRLVKKARKAVELMKSALINGLTDLPNRRFFEKRLAGEWSRSERNNQETSSNHPKKDLVLIFIDIDYFKRVNDTYGHSGGDAVLKELAKILKGSVKRGSDFVARFGGEEFVILLPETGLEGAIVLAEKLRAAIEKTTFEHGGKEIKITASFGIAGKESSATKEDFVKRADVALYEAKEAGRNRVISDSGSEQKQAGEQEVA